MIIITAIYVIATICIFWANCRSANATREQIVESKRQYEDRKRLEILPHIQFEKTNDTANYELRVKLDSDDILTEAYNTQLCIKNIGNGTAKDITCEQLWDNNSEGKNKVEFPIQALIAGEKQTIKVRFFYNARKPGDRCIEIILHYKDLLENTYTQRVQFNVVCENSARLNSVVFSTSSPVFESK